MLENISLVISVIFLYIGLGFFASVILKRNDIADVMWGPGIFLAALTAYILSDSSSVLTLFIISLWGLRIFTHIGLRFLGKKEEDFRYKVWRETWKYFYVRSFLQVFLLQGFLMILVASSVIYFYLKSFEASGFMFFAFSILALCSLVYESVADLQLKKFIKENKNNPDKNVILSKGLWKYSRHPNYFGEVSFWWFIFLSLVSATSDIDLAFSHYLILLISPLTISYLILYVSGIPLLENKYIGNQNFDKYKSKTPAFFPNFFL